MLKISQHNPHLSICVFDAARKCERSFLTLVDDADGYQLEFSQEFFKNFDFVEFLRVATMGDVSHGCPAFGAKHIPAEGSTEKPVALLGYDLSEKVYNQYVVPLILKPGQKYPFLENKTQPILF